MKKLIHFCNKTIQNGLIALSVILISLISLTAYGQSQPNTLASITPVSTASASSTENYGKITGEGDGREYIAIDGKNVYRIGDNIHIGLGSGLNQQFKFITSKVSKKKFLKLLGSSILGTSLDREYEGQVFTITDMYMGVASNTDALLKNAPQRAFLIFKVNGKDYEAAIEPALLSKEVIPSN